MSIDLSKILDTDLFAGTGTDGVTYKVTGEQFKGLFEEEVEVVYHIKNITVGYDGSNRVSVTGGDKVYRLVGDDKTLIHEFFRDAYTPPTQEELEALEDILDNQGEAAFVEAYDATYDNFVLDPGHEYLVTGPLARFSGSLGQWEFGPLTDTATKTDWRAFLAVSAYDAPLDNLDFSALNQCDLMFCEAEYFNQSVSAIDTSNCTTLIGMFLYAIRFNQPVNHLVGSNITNIDNMFKYCKAFNQPLDAWDVSNVTSMVGAIYECSNFNQDVSMWNTMNVEAFDKEYENGLFSYCTNFDQDLSQWCVPKVTSKPGQWASGTAQQGQTDKYPCWGHCPRGENGVVDPCP